MSEKDLRYKNYDWLYRKYIEEGLTASEVAYMCGVHPTTITKNARRLGMEKKSKERVTVNCFYCEEPITALKSYVDIRERRGSGRVYCDNTCFSLQHSIDMSGSTNPRYGVKSEICPNDYRTPEMRSRHAKEAWERHRKNGMYEERIRKWHKGHDEYLKTEEGIKVTREAAYKGMRIASGSKETSIEKSMREELQSRGVTFKAEEPFAKRFSFDFFIPCSSIAIECDGDYWHNRPEVKEKDARKDELANASGIKTFRFTETQINESVEACVDVVLTYINELDEGREAV